MNVIRKINVRCQSVIEELDEFGICCDSDKTETLSNGVLTLEDGGVVLSYTEDSEGGRINSRVEIKDGAVAVKKTGAVECDFRFFGGGEHASLYGVPPYKFDVVIKTKRISCDMGEDGGSVLLNYRMTIGGADKNVRMKILAEVVK